MKITIKIKGAPKPPPKPKPPKDDKIFGWPLDNIGKWIYGE